MRIDGREIGPGNAPWVCAEISGEHKGDFARCLDLIRAAKDAGADSVKLQCFDPERLAEARGGRDKVLTEGLWAGRSLIDLYRETHTPRAFISEAIEWGKHWGITVFSSVFDEEGVDYLDGLGCPALKIASFELTDIALIRKAASTGKPVILSSGMAIEEDIRAALAQFLFPEEPSTIRVRECGLLHCVSAYPCSVEDAQLDRMKAMLAARPHLPIGLSDHTLGSIAPVVATALGASIIEKHITLDRKNGGPDAPFSLEPHEFAKMVQDVKDAYASLGTGERPASEEIYRGLRRTSA